MVGVVFEGVLSLAESHRMRLEPGDGGVVVSPHLDVLHKKVLDHVLLQGVTGSRCVTGTRTLSHYLLLLHDMSQATRPVSSSLLVLHRMPLSTARVILSHTLAVAIT